MFVCGGSSARHRAFHARSITLHCGAADGRRRTSSGPAGTRRGSICVKKSELRGVWEVGGIGDLRLCGEPGFTGTEVRRKTPDGASPPSPQSQFLNTNRAFLCSAAPFSLNSDFLAGCGLCQEHVAKHLGIGHDAAAHRLPRARPRRTGRRLLGGRPCRHGADLELDGVKCVRRSRGVLTSALLRAGCQLVLST